MFESNSIPLQRKSVDSITNVYGSQLIDFCKFNNIFMLNGRFGLDHTSPKLTCKDSSVVDYILTSAYNFEMISSFEVLEFNCLYSDAHCPLSLSMDILDPKMKHWIRKQNTPTLPKVKLWDETKKDLFVENINLQDIDDISSKLDSFRAQDCTAQDINTIISRIENIFVSNAKNTFGVKKNFRQINNHRHKQWFTFECKTARNRYHSTRKKYNKYKTPYYKNMLKMVSKDYKNKIAQSLRKFKNNRINQLKTLKTSNPREFWKIINSIDKSKETKPPLKELYTYFKSLTLVSMKRLSVVKVIKIQMILHYIGMIWQP